MPNVTVTDEDVDPNSPASELPGSITESIAIANAKSVAEQPATLSNMSLGNLVQNVNLSQQNTVSNQHNVNGIQQAILSKVVNLLTTLRPLEAMSAQQILTGNSLAEEISGLKAAISSLTGGGGSLPRIRRRRGLPGQTRQNPITNWSKVYLRPKRDINVVVERSQAR